MTYDVFKKYIFEQIRSIFPKDTSVSIQTIHKNNQVSLDSLTISEQDCNLSPAIYLNDLYSLYCSGTAPDQIIQRILTIYQQYKPENSIDISFFTNFSRIRGNIFFRLINHKKNEELLQEIPHFRYLDLAIVFYTRISTSDFADGTILIHNSHLKLWDVTPEQLYELARHNTPAALAPLCQPLTGMLMDMVDDEELSSLLSDIPSENVPQLYVLTNEKMLFGACALLYPDALKQLAQKLRQDLYILPSSIHEVLLLPAAKGINPARLCEMVYEVNHTQLAPEDILSDQVYFYSHSRDSLWQVPQSSTYSLS
ncbi:MAG: hypothetical protein IJ567_02290 [Lachnospiraceae bacterium]|nr:hypothetical protein [Lachnospiraceae bacterium]